MPHDERVIMLVAVCCIVAGHLLVGVAEYRRSLDASPFRRYETDPMASGWTYLLHAEGALNHEAFARTRSEDFAQRAVEAMNRAHPRKLRNPFGPPKAGWF